ncbi:MFS transporter [Streptomyces hesseae]|uniref:MFS transporter n=1 Tax=Streptomyces hesseae TaxID=3075519 RepID=A0ABU2SIF9_9ACTN|nr:MFS transporter [Streptomyces sp. DSM 40473]MDT0447689.1 MFS transporter [Streptomyces sp. DSM 40473]
MTEAARARLVLLVSVAGAMIVALDGTVLSVAQPSLQRDFGAGVAQVQWTSTSYLLAVAALLVVAGRLGDRYGHPLMLRVGLVGFAAASAGIALAPGIGWVIGLRAVQGVFGALLQPATLALLRSAYPEERLGRAVALRTSAIGVAAAAGPVLGGALVGPLGWRAVFVINVPVALASAAVTLAVRAPAPPHDGSRQLDLPGAALLTTALAVLVHTLVGVPEHGWTAPPTLLGLAAVAGLATAFVAHERRAARPIVPRAVARSVPVTASMTLLLVTSAGMFGALFVTTFFLQNVLGFGPFDCGLRVLPLTALMVLGAPVAGAALRRHGPRRTAMTGALLVVLGVAGLSRLDADSPWTVAGAAFAVLGAGFATVMVTATGTVVGDAPTGYAGVVGGLKQTAMNVGPAFGIAVAAGMMLLQPQAGATPRMGPTLLVLAGVTALGLLPAALLPRGGTPGKGTPVRGEPVQDEPRPVG